MKRCLVGARLQLTVISRGAQAHTASFKRWEMQRKSSGAVPWKNTGGQGWNSITTSGCSCARDRAQPVGLTASGHEAVQAQDWQFLQAF